MRCFARALTLATAVVACKSSEGVSSKTSQEGGAPIEDGAADGLSAADLRVLAHYGDATTQLVDQYTFETTFQGPPTFEPAKPAKLPTLVDVEGQPYPVTVVAPPLTGSCAPVLHIALATDSLSVSYREVASFGPRPDDGGFPTVSLACNDWVTAANTTGLRLLVEARYPSGLPVSVHVELTRSQH
jgi:hypothetical protein